MNKGTGVVVAPGCMSVAQIYGAVGEGLPVHPRYEVDGANRKDRESGTQGGESCPVPFFTTEGMR